MAVNGAIIKAVIWDLDDTFWTGTLADDSNAVRAKDEMISILKSLTSRGIVNSICSKNDYGIAESALQDMGVFDLFVFASINWEPKGRRVSSLIEQMQLRPVNVLFVDDNHSNRSEVLYYNPDIQVMHPDDWSSCSILSWGKDDPGHTRLQQYKLLEARKASAMSFSSNDEFLKDSCIQIKMVSVTCESSLLGRLHELANRAWQLNYTRRKFPRFAEDFLPSLKNCTSFAIVVKDRYGDHGVAGYICIDAGGTLLDFLFSCRIMGMRVETACLRWLHERGVLPSLHQDVFASVDEDVSFISIGEACELNMESEQIKVTEDSRVPAVLLAGSCFMDSISSFLENRFSVALHTNEAPFHCVKDVLLQPDLEWLALVKERFGLEDSHYAEFSRALDAAFDAVVVNFNWDLCFPAYKMQGKYVPLMMFDRLSHTNCEEHMIWRNRQRANAKEAKHRGRNPHVMDLEFIKSCDLQVLMSHIRDFRAHLPSSVRLILVTTTPVSNSSYYADLYNEWVPELSVLLHDVVASLPNSRVLDLAKFDGVAKGDGMHYSREVLHQISERLEELILSKS